MDFELIALGLSAINAVGVANTARQADLSRWTIEDILYRPSVAIAELQRLLAQAEMHSDHRGSATAHLLLGGAYAAAGNLLRGDHHLDQAVGLFTETGDQRELARATLFRYRIWTQRGQLDIAVDRLSVALETARAYNDLELEYWILTYLGTAKCDAGELERGNACFIDAIEIARLNPELCDILARFNLAFSHIHQNDYEIAATWLREGLADCVQLNKPHFALHGARFLAICERELGRHAEAVALFQVAADYARQASSDRGIAAAYYELGELQFSQGNKMAALVAFREAAAAHRRLIDFAPSINGRLTAWWIASLTNSVSDDLLADLEAIEPRLDSVPAHSAIRLLDALSLSYERRGDTATALAYARKSTARQASYWKVIANAQAHLAAKRHQADRAQQAAENERKQREALALAFQRATELNRHNELLVEQLRAQSNLLEQQASEDSLTEIPNRRLFDTLIEREIARSARYNRPICLAMIDLDNFKQINDQHSHLIGDDVLRMTARIFRGLLRQTDAVARYGGEEFAVIFSETDLDAAILASERLRVAIERYPWSRIAPDLTVTISVGVITGTGAMQPTELISAADAMLYLAKNCGKNQVMSPSHPVSCPLKSAD